MVIASSAATDPTSGDGTIELGNVVPGSEIYFQVSGARGDALGMGSYRLEVNSGAVSEQQIGAIDTVLTAVAPANRADSAAGRAS